MDTRRIGDLGRLTGAPLPEDVERPATKQRFHDVIDLHRGEVETRPVARTLGAATRAKRLTRLGYHVDASIFAAPIYRLSPRVPYQASPEAWVDAFGGDFSTGPGNEQVWWRLPRFFETEFMSGINVNFAAPPTGPLVLSLAIEAWPYQDATGVVVVEIGALRVETPISVAGARVIDIGFVNDDEGFIDARVFWRPGLYDFVFKSVALGPGLVVLTPGTLSDAPVLG